jgi:hypothetical protein
LGTIDSENSSTLARLRQHHAVRLWCAQFDQRAFVTNAFTPSRSVPVMSWPSLGRHARAKNSPAHWHGR